MYTCIRNIKPYLHTCLYDTEMRLHKGTRLRMEIASFLLRSIIEMRNLMISDVNTGI